MRVAVTYMAKEDTYDIIESLFDILGGFLEYLSGTSGEIFWDADPAHAAQQDLPLFQDYADPQLPLIDLGAAMEHKRAFLRIILQG